MACDLKIESASADPCELRPISGYRTPRFNKKNCIFSSISGKASGGTAVRSRNENSLKHLLDIILWPLPALLHSIVKIFYINHHT